MCGIAGVLFKQQGSHDIGKTLIEMLDGCQHRGPDSTGFAMYGEDQDLLQLQGHAPHQFRRAQHGRVRVLRQLLDAIDRALLAFFVTLISRIDPSVPGSARIVPSLMMGESIRPAPRMV